ncbi:PEBP-like protein [Westerdykella ornata]|uniref:PEBP-like protein n=1 Tax=Westerdykella ornata TaxID=318751 RepID=A0A6A6K1V1_WESOR|nr:PEBP-like protein [Westerdykella ornata]KAF2281359.1 PEBP-like protein [Westerdykella ornata]
MEVNTNGSTKQWPGFSRQRSSQQVQATAPIPPKGLLQTKEHTVVIDDFLPSLALSVAWAKKTANLGNTIKPKHVQDRPTVRLHDDTSSGGWSTSNMTYVLTLTDPDAPSREDPKWAEMCHWIVANVSLSRKTHSVLPSIVDAGGMLGREAKGTLDDEVVEWKPPGPPPKTGKHRYVFLAFAPRNGTTSPLNLSKPSERKHWGTGKKGGGVREWAEENGLIPVGANFIYSENAKQ